MAQLHLATLPAGVAIPDAPLGQGGSLTWLDDKEPEHSRFSRFMDHVEKVVNALIWVVIFFALAYLVWQGVRGR